MGTRIKHRRDTAANWTSNNPTLSSGEFGIETDTSNMKIGDGTTAWNSLMYLTATNINPSNEDTDTTCFPLFVNTATGGQVTHTNPKFILNSNNSTLGIDNITSVTANTDLVLSANGTGQIKLNDTVYTALDSVSALAIRNASNQAALEVDTTGIRKIVVINVDGTNGLIDTTAANTGQSLYGGGIYAAKNIMTSARMNVGPYKFLKQGTATLGSTNASLDISSLPAFHSYKIFLEVQQSGIGAYYLRILINGDSATNKYSTIYLSGTSVAAVSFLSTAQGVWIASTNNQIYAANLEINVAGFISTATNKIKITYDPTWEFGTNSNVLMGGNYLLSSQVSSVSFEVYTSFNGTTRYTATDVITLSAEVYGCTLTSNTWS